jgi:hypothetical protein
VANVRNSYTKKVADKVGWPVNWWPPLVARAQGGLHPKVGDTYQKGTLGLFVWQPLRTYNLQPPQPIEQPIVLADLWPEIDPNSRSLRNRNVSTSRPIPQSHRSRQRRRQQSAPVETGQTLASPPPPELPAAYTPASGS